MQGAEGPKHGSWGRSAALAGGLGVLYYAGARLGLAFVIQPEGLAVLWPSAGILYGALLRSRRSLWPLFTGVAFLVVTATNLRSGNSLALSLGFAVTNCTESLLAAAAVRLALGATPRLERLKDVLIFAGVGAVGASSLTAFLGAGVVHLGTGGAYWDVWTTLWVEDCVGMLVVGAAFLESVHAPRKLREPGRLLEALVLLGLVGMGSLLVFSANKDAGLSLVVRPYILLPLLYLMAIRLGSLGAAWGTVPVAVGAVWGVLHSGGAFASVGATPRIEIIATQIFLGVAAFSTLGAAALYSERRILGDRQRQILYELSRHLSNAPLGVVEFDGEYRITRWAGRAEEIFGWSAEEVLGKKIGDFRWVHADDVARVESLLADMAAAHRASNVQQNRNYRKDGTVVHCEWYNSALQDKGGKLVSVFSQVLDVTAREQARASMVASEAKYRAAIETQPDGFWMVDLEGRLLEVNGAYARRTGYSPEELVSLRVSDLEARESAAETAQHMGVVLREGGDLFESVHRAKDGTLFPVEVSASYSPIDGGRVFSLVRDIGKRKRAELLLRARVDLAETSSRGEVHDVLQQALDAAELLTGSAIGFFHFVDDDQVNLTLQTWSTNTQKNMCTAQGQGGHYPIAFAGVWVDCVRTRTPVVHNDYGSLAHRKGLPEGHAPVVRELVVPILRNGKIEAIVGVGNKTTDYVEDDVEPVRELASMAMDFVVRRRAEEELERLYGQARQDAETRRRLLMEVNHRVKNNLISLMGVLLAEKRLAPPEGGSVESVLERLTARVRGLLSAHDLLSATNWAPVRVTQLAARVFHSALGGTPGPAVEILPSDLVVSPRQAGGLAMILNELATNTAKHGGTGEGSLARLEISAAEGFLRLEYRDAGPGYPDEILAGNHRNVGLRLMREIAEGTLRGSLVLSNDKGAVATVRMKTESLGLT